MKLKIWIVAWLLVAGLAGTASAQDFRARLLQQGAIVVGTSGSAPPFSMTNAQSQLAGFDIDVMNRLGQELGLAPRYVQVDFAGLLPGLTAGRFDVVASGVTRTPQRLSTNEFRLLSPYIVNGVVITRRAGEARPASWRDVCGLRMGGVRGGVFQRIAVESLPANCVAETREYPGWTEMLLDLRNRRIDFMAHDFLGPRYQIEQGTQGIEVMRDVLDTVTQGLAVSANNPALADTIEGYLARWRNDGTLDAIIKKWFGAALDWSLVK